MGATIILSTLNKINRILFFSLTLLLLVMASAGVEANTDISGNNKEKVTIQLKWYHQFQFAGYYAAVEKGFYAEEGLQVELRQRVAGTSHIEDVLQGRAQYGVSDAGLLLTRQQGKPVVLLAQILQHSPLVLLTRKDSGIRSAEDLAGKRVMFDAEGDGNMPIIAMLLKTFNKLDAVEVQQISFNPQDLIDGKTDAYASYLTNQPDWYHQRNVDVNIIDPRDYGIDHAGDNLFTTEQELAEHPERVEKIRRATLKGWEYALKNSEEIVELILEKYNPKEFNRDHLMYQARMYNKLIAADLVELGKFSQSRYQKIAEDYAKAGFMEQRKLDPGFFYSQTNIHLNIEELAWLAEHPGFKVAAFPLAPYIMQEEGKLTGYMPELLQLISSKVKLTPQFNYHEVSNDAFKAVNIGKLLAAMGVIQTPERAQHVAFCPEAIPLHLAIFAQKTATSINNLDSLKDKRIASYHGYAIDSLLKEQLPDANYIMADDAVGMLQLVATGKADAAIQELHTGKYMLSKYYINNLEVKDIAKFKRLKIPLGHSYVVNKKFPVLKSILDKAYLSLSENEKQSLWKKWFSGSGPFQQLDEQHKIAKQAVVIASPVWLIVVSLAAFTLLALLMFRMSRKKDIEQQFGSKRFRYGLLILFFLIVSIVIMLAWWLLEYNKQQILEHNRLKLETALHTTHERLNIWIEHHKIYLQQLARNSELVSITEELLKISPKSETLLSSSALVDARHFFYDNQNTFGEKGFFIISPERISLGSMRDSNLGIRNLIAKHKPELLDRVFRGELLFIPPIQSDVQLTAGTNANDSTMFFAAPIRNKNGKVIAVLTQRLDPLAKFSRVIQFGHIGETGETYAFNKQGRLLSVSRFNKQLRSMGLIGANQHSNLFIDIRDPGGNLQTGYKPKVERSKQALTRMAASAVRGESGIDMMGYRDYRGVTVQGAWLWDNNLSIGMATEIDVDEVMFSYYLVRNSILGVLILTLLLSSAAIFFTLFTGERVSRNLRYTNRQLQLEITEREVTERKLKDREVREAAIVNTVIDSIITINAKGIIESFNPAAESMFGYDANDVIGRNVNILVPEPYHDEHDGYLDRYHETGKANIIGFGRELEAVRRDGSVFPMELSVSEMQIGEEQKFTGVIRDITERKKAEEELSKSVKLYHSLVEAINEGLAVIDENGIYTYVNEQFCKMLGYSMTEIIGAHWMNFQNEDAQKVIEEQLKKRAKGSSEHYELETTRKDGKKIWINISPNPIYNEDGNIKGSMGLVQDITERKNAEDELRKAYDEMESRVRERTSELLAEKENAEIANQAKNNFLSNMSHELRTPLNAILGYAHILQNDDSINHAQREKIKIIERSGEHLLEQISDVLDVAKIEANKIDLVLSTINIKNYLEHICHYFTSQVEAKGLELICTVDESSNLAIQIDERRLQQILLNLISNAVKFTIKGKVIVKIDACESVTVSSEKECCWCFSVEDTGIGIAKENMEQIFQPFVQVKQENHQNEGTGLGLNIAQKLVRLMGGELKVASEEYKGSRFWFELTLPVAEEVSESPIQRRRSPIGYHGKKRKILVVDDIKDSREMSSDTLTALGFQTVVASKGLDAVIMAKDMQPDLILMDLLMPGLNGYESLTTLRNIPECKDIPVVAMSANVSEENPAMLAGFDHFLPKPTAADELTSTLGKLLNLEWIYKSGKLEVEESRLIPPALTELEKLKDLAQLGKMKRIVEWADSELSRDSEYRDFNLHIRELAREVKDVEIMALLDGYLGESPHVPD